MKRCQTFVGHLYVYTSLDGAPLSFLRLRSVSPCPFTTEAVQTPYNSSESFRVIIPSSTPVYYPILNLLLPQIFGLTHNCKRGISIISSVFSNFGLRMYQFKRKILHLEHHKIFHLTRALSVHLLFVLFFDNVTRTPLSQLLSTFRFDSISLPFCFFFPVKCLDKDSLLFTVCPR